MSPSQLSVACAVCLPRCLCSGKTEGQGRAQVTRLLCCNESMSSGNDGEYRDRMVLAPPTRSRQCQGSMLQKLGEQIGWLFRAIQGEPCLRR
eukprot:2412138-Rhodomonas_salina.2